MAHRAVGRGAGNSELRAEDTSGENGLREGKNLPCGVAASASACGVVGGRAAPTDGPGGAVREGGATRAAERGVRGWAGAVRCECGP